MFFMFVLFLIWICVHDLYNLVVFGCQRNLKVMHPIFKVLPHYIHMQKRVKGNEYKVKSS